MASPRNSCVHVVNRLASEYQNTIASATGESMKHSGFSRDVANTNRADAHDDERGSLGRAHGTARNLAIRRPWIQRVKSTIDEAVEPHRGRSGGHHRHENPADAAPRHGRVASRQQRTGQRERKREDRVTEANERQIGANPTEHHDDPASSHRICSGWTPDTRYSSTSSTAPGTETASSRARFPGSIVP